MMSTDYEVWERTVPEGIKGDAVWKLRVYRLSLFAADLGWEDVCKLVRDRRTVGLADQLYRAIGSISANIVEGFSRGSGRDRARFYEYALGSARESRGLVLQSPPCPDRHHNARSPQFAHRNHPPAPYHDPATTDCFTA